MTAVDVVVGLIIIICISESEVCCELFLLFLIVGTLLYMTVHW